MNARSFETRVILRQVINDVLVGFVFVIVHSESKSYSKRTPTDGQHILLSGKMMHVFVASATATGTVPVAQDTDGRSEE